MIHIYAKDKPRLSSRLSSYKEEDFNRTLQALIPSGSELLMNRKNIREYKYKRKINLRK